MPQNYDFNGGSWVTIENKVRGWVVPDTLFVVTGTLFEGSTRTLSKGDYTVTIPSHAYKLLLRTKKGNTKKYIIDITSADELQCAAFVKCHEAPKGSSVSSQDMISISELEKLTGFSYFPNVPNAPKSSYKASDWGL